MPDSIDNHIACDKHCEFVDIALSKRREAAKA
jgi:hypothetical protein